MGEGVLRCERGIVKNLRQAGAWRDARRDLTNAHEVREVRVRVKK
jgi:hypothetical protein